MGELWAIPIMLRLALIENLRRVAARIAADRVDRNRADYWADQMTAIAAKDPKSLILSIADMARSDPPMAGSFVAEFARRLQGQSAALALPLTWIEQRLAEDGLTIEQLVQSENQQQAADQVSISNSIGSLRFLGAAGLARVRRDDERRRAGPARGPGRRLRPDGLRHARPLPPRRRRRWQAERPDGDRGGPARDRPRPAGGRRPPAATRRRATSATTSSARGSHSWSGRPACAFHRRVGRGAGLPPPPADALRRERDRPHAGARGGARHESAQRRRPTAGCWAWPASSCCCAPARWPSPS